LSITEEIEEVESAPALPFIPPPGEDDLPSDDGVPMETERHKLQMDLLIYSYIIPSVCYNKII